MDNASTSTNATAAAPADNATQTAATNGRTLRRRTTAVAQTTQAGHAKQNRSNGKKPARKAAANRSRTTEALPDPAGLGSGVTSRLTSQEPDYPTVAHPIFAVTSAPKVEDISHEALTRWVDLRLEYEEIMRARCESSGEDLKSVMRSVRNSFDDSFLETLCETKWEKTKEELTDEFVWEWIMTTVRSFKNNALPNIDELFRNQLVMSNNKSDVDARVMDYFHLCNTIIKTNGLTALFSEDDGTKKKCKVLLSCLPDDLKTRVKNEIDFRLPAAKSSVSVLFKLVSEKALEIDREDRALTRNKRRPPVPESKSAMPSRPVKRARIVSDSGKNHKAQPQPEIRTIFRTDSETSRPGPKDGCWNCGGQHKQVNCPEKSDGDPTAARQQKPGRHRKAKKN